MITLFNDIQEFKKYIAISTDLEILDITPSVEEATEYIITNYLGQEFYQELHQKYEAQDLDDDWQELLNYVRRPIANLSYYYYLPISLLNISSNGARAIEGDNIKSAQPWQINNLKFAVSSAAYNGIESLLAYLESKRTVFTQWAESDIGKESVELIVPSATAFQEYFNINSQRRTYSCLKPIIRKVHDFDIKECLGKKNYDELIEQLRNRNVAQKWKEVLPDLRGAVVNYSIARAAVELKIHISNNGVSVKEFGESHSLKKLKDAETADTMQLRLQTMADGDRYLRRVRAYLTENSDQFNNYTTPDTTEGMPYPAYINKKDQGTFTA